MLKFIRREKIYLLILFFILAVNSMQAKDVQKKEPVGKSLSSMSFEELGVTEERVKDFFESDKLSAKFFKYLLPFGFFIFILSLILNFMFIFRGERKKIDFKAPHSKETVSWEILDIFRAILIIVFAGYVLAIIEAFILKFFHLGLTMNLRMIISTFFIDIVAVTVILYFVMVKYKRNIQELGLKTSSFFKNILSGITAYIFMLPILLVILIFSVWILNVFGYKSPPQPIFEVFMEEKKSFVLLFLTVFVSILGPVVEEVFFRGFMYSAVKKHTSILAAAVLSGAIFSLLHTNIAGFLPIMALGVLLAYLYETTGSLVASISVHILHNSIIVTFVFFLKELIG
ncbi:lysostaphin resistance A-like protein [Candidatus Omnitrophota bacterium]